MNVHDDVEVESLLRYLRDLAQLRMRPILDVRKYDYVMWFDHVPDHAKIRSAARPGQLDDQPEWLIVDRVDLPQRPEPPEAVVPWIRGELDDFGQEPEIREVVVRIDDVDTGSGPVPTEVEERLSDHPDIRRSWLEYLDRWRAWSVTRAELAPVHDLYTDLFRAAERARQVGEQYETVVAVGLVAVEGERGTVMRHLLTAPATISLDAETGRISLEPTGEANSSVRLEQDMLAPGESPPADTQAAVREQISDVDPLDLESVTPTLETWTNAASASARFQAELSPDITPGTDLVVRLAPALITRPRSQQAVVDTYDAILEAVDDDGEIPPTFADLTTTSGDELTDAERSASGLDLDSEQWFPLPANDEQARIVEALRTRRGVIVHGPPGTGKSHTIANLISHALATGQRVLVTAHSARALEVLSDKLPDDIRALTVTLLGEGRRGTDDLERSANEILRRRQDAEWQTSEIQERLARLRQNLNDLKEERRSLIADLGEARTREAQPVALGFGSFEGTLADLARELGSTEPTPTWLEVEPTGPAPIDDDELTELVSLHDRLTDDDMRLARTDLPPAGSVSDPDAVAATIAGHAVAVAHVESVSDVPEAQIDQIQRLDADARARYMSASQAEHDAAAAVSRRQSPWLDQVTADLDRNQTERWRTLWNQSAELTAAGWDLPQLDRLQVTVGSQDRLPHLRAQADALATFFRDGGKLRMIKPKAYKDAQELITTVTVDGAVPDTLDRCEAFVRWCDARAAFALVERSWPQGAILPQQTFLMRHTAIVEAVQAVADCFTLHQRRTELAAVVHDERIDVGVLPGRADVLERAWAASQARVHLATADAAIEDLVGRISPPPSLHTVNPIVEQLTAAVRAGDGPRYRVLHAELDDLRRRRDDVDRHTQLLERLRDAAPDCAAMVEAGKGDDLMPFGTRWDEARARRWLREVESPDANSITRTIAKLNDRVRAVITEMGANQAWLHAINRLSDSHTQHLKGYQTAMKRVGKGNSKFDFKYRQEARAHLAHCQDAVPAWVMPAHQVAANVAPVPGTFDLVILDEASQSGVEELFLFWLGKQVVVVGDKHQISPEGSFVKGDAQDLQRRHLEGWSFAGEFGPENSLFDVAEVKYVAGEVWLSEHFRCMPEIIEYSNQLCYADHRLEPVRQFGTDRLQPLRSTHVPHVPDGRAAASKINRDEADALVAQVLACLDDPQYRHPDGTPMTIGVISLLGTDHAKHIQRQLLERVDPDQWMERRIHVGDAADFQGDERDVVFLSMVTTPPADGRRVPKLGHDRDRRRFNVAASRARNQLWLFHSVELDHLNPECPRARLLAHIRNPTRAGLDGFHDAVDPDDLRPPFESLFEQRVFLDLVNRGYVVEPQWKVLGYRIDLVVVGADSRLALECDGDAWHGPDRYAADLARQGDLERVGWTFVRVKEWEYYADKSEALAPLWDALERLEIGPGAIAAPAATPPPFTGVLPPLPAPQFTAPEPLPEPMPEPESGLELEPAAVPEPAAVAAKAAVAEKASESVFEAAGSADHPPVTLPSLPKLDPLTASPNQLLEAIRAVVEAEGPVLVERTFQLVNETAGNKRLGGRIRGALMRALQLGLSDRALVADDPLGQGPMFATLRLPQQPEVVVRRIGNREFQHIPPREIAAQLQALGIETGLTGHDLYRRCHLGYGFSRMRETSAEHYAACEALVD